MARTRLKEKGRRESGSFIAIPHAVIEHENFHVLSHAAVRLLVDLFGQYRGLNNGDLSASWTLMKKRGWRSKSRLAAALAELEDRGFVVLTRQGGRNRCSLYAVTWLPIQECNNKLDRSSTKVALGWWKLGYDPEKNPYPARGAASGRLPPWRGNPWAR